MRKSILKIYPKRRPDSHKYDFGSLLIIGGSKLYSGSPALAALAAYRAGVDLVTVVAPRRAADIIASFSPDLIAYPLKGDYLNSGHLKELLKLAKSKTAVVIGGGLCRRKETLKTVAEFLKKTKLPCVIDADAIYAVAEYKPTLRPNSIITPHAYEFYVLGGKEPREEEAVKELASKLNATILLKGNIDIISNGREVALNETGCPEMTVGGTGDTLAGICGALLAQSINGFDAACCAAYINGKAGSLAAKEKKQGLTATDLIEKIPKIL